MWCVGVNIYFSKRHRVVGTFLTYLLRRFGPLYVLYTAPPAIFILDSSPSRRAADALKMIEQQSQRTVPSALLVLPSAHASDLPPHAM